MTRLYWRLLLWFCLANVVTLLVSVFVTQRIAQQLYRQAIDWPMIARQTIDAIEPQAVDPLKAIRPLRLMLRRRHIEIGLIDDQGHVWVDPPHSIWRHLTELGESAAVRLHPRPGITLVSLALDGPNGKLWRFYAAQYPRPPDPNHLWLPFLIEILVSLLVIGGVGWRVARGISGPVGAVQRAARRVADGDLTARVDPPLTETPGELGQLARDFDHMASRIQSLVERQRTVLQDLSHELRSPLARLGVALELARGDAGDVVLPALDRAEREIDRLDRLIGEVLELARMEDRIPGMLRSRLDVGALLRERVAEAAYDATGRGIRLLTEATDGLYISGSAILLGRAIDNLLSNAIKFTPPGGEIRVALSSHDDQIELNVEDSGPGVPAADLPSLFRPFFRGGNASRAEGQGLGLAIVSRIVSAHAGYCSVENFAPHGLRVRLTLPGDRDATGSLELIRK